MTPQQLEISQALGQVKYLPASFDKRLARGISLTAKHAPEIDLTEKQNEWMYRLLYKYRRQIPSVYEKYKDNPLCSQLKKM